jgi:F-type H+-transporting ATPase subunit epsilon
MLPKELELDIVTPEKRIVSMSVDEVVIPGTEGSMGILPGHAPLLTALDVGELMYRSGTTKKYVAIAQGFAEVLPMRVTVLAQVAERAEEIDRERAGKARDRALERLQKSGPEVDFERAQNALRRSHIRLLCCEKAGGEGS